MQLKSLLYYFVGFELFVIKIIIICYMTNHNNYYPIYIQGSTRISGKAVNTQTGYNADG